MRPGRLSGAGMAIMASPRHDGDVGDAVHPRTARGPAAGPRIADAARYRRDAQGDLAAQAGGKRGAGRAHQRTPRAPPRRHRIPLPHSTQKGFGIDEAVAGECDSVKLSRPSTITSAHDWESTGIQSRPEMRFDSSRATTPSESSTEPRPPLY